MNTLTPVNTLTMTSRDIAELVEARHDNVKRTIETLVEKGVIAFPQIEEKPTAGRPVAEYVFCGEQGKRDSIIIVAQLSPQFTAKLVDRWQELESKIRQPIAQEAKSLPPSKQAKEALEVMDKAMRYLQRWGFDKNASLISAKRHTNGTPIQQVKWADTVLPILQAA